jgi:hypothetical protein
MAIVGLARAYAGQTTAAERSSSQARSVGRDLLPSWSHPATHWKRQRNIAVKFPECVAEFSRSIAGLLLVAEPGQAKSRLHARRLPDRDIMKRPRATRKERFFGLGTRNLLLSEQVSPIKHALRRPFITNRNPTHGEAVRVFVSEIQGITHFAISSASSSPMVD